MPVTLQTLLGNIEDLILPVDLLFRALLPRISENN